MFKAVVIKSAVNTVLKFTTKHAPELLLGIGIAGTVTATVIAAKASPAANDHIRQAEKQKGDTLTFNEKSKACWKDYAVAAAFETVSVGCLIASGKIQHGRNVSLAAAYALSSKALSEYAEKTIETVGDKKAEEIKQKIVKSQIDKAEPAIKALGEELNNKYAVIEPITAKVIPADIETVKSAINTIDFHINHNTYNDFGDDSDFVPFNDFLEALGLPSSALGSSFGWELNYDCDRWSGKKELLSDHIRFEAGLDSDNKPCYVIIYSQLPGFKY